MPGQDRPLDPPELPSEVSGNKLDWQYFGDGEWAAESTHEGYTNTYVIRLIEGTYRLYVVRGKTIADLAKAVTP